jgi:hypothetical protein
MPPSPDVQPGDLMLITKRNEDPLASFVSELDGSPFSHCGIAVRDGLVANCRTSPAIWKIEDTGGVRFDPISVFTDAHREVWRARPLLEPAAISRAVDFAEQFSQDGRPGAQQSSFGFTEMFLVSCGLNARSPRASLPDDAREAIFSATLAAGRAATWTTTRAAFFCSEFVAAAFGQPFELSAFDPPLVPFVDIESWVVPRGLPGFVARLESELDGLRAKAALAKLVATVFAYDVGYLLEAFETVTAWKQWEASQPPAPEPGSTEPPDPGSVPPPRVPAAVTPRGALPTSLITPRMLWRAPWVEKAELVARPAPRNDPSAVI